MIIKIDNNEYSLQDRISSAQLLVNNVSITSDYSYTIPTDGLYNFFGYIENDYSASVSIYIGSVTVGGYRGRISGDSYCFTLPMKKGAIVTIKITTQTKLNIARLS